MSNRDNLTKAAHTAAKLTARLTDAIGRNRTAPLRNSDPQVATDLTNLVIYLANLGIVPQEDWPHGDMGETVGDLLRRAAKGLVRRA